MSRPSVPPSVETSTQRTRRRHFLFDSVASLSVDLCPSQYAPCACEFLSWGGSQDSRAPSCIITAPPEDPCFVTVVR